MQGLSQLASSHYQAVYVCVKFQCECALVAASYGYILKVHMNEHTLLLDNVLG